MRKYSINLFILISLLCYSTLIAEEEHAIFLFMPYKADVIIVEGNHFNPRAIALGKIQDSEESHTIFRVDDSSKVNKFKFKMGEDQYIFPINWDQGRYVFIDLRNGIRIQNYKENNFSQKILIPSKKD